jgi:hypothetical protein
MGHAVGRGDHVFATLGTGLVLALAWATVWIQWPRPDSFPIGYDGAPVRSLFDVTAQRHLHEVALIGVAVLGLGALLGLDFLTMAKRVSRLVIGICFAAAALSFVALTWALPSPEAQAATFTSLFNGQYGLRTVMSAGAFIWVGAAAAVAFLVCLIVRPPTPPGWVIWAGILVYVVALELPGYFWTPRLDAAPPGALQGVEWHFDAVIGAKNQLLLGSQPRDFGYGVGLEATLAAIERILGPFSFAGDIRLIQTGNLLFAGLSVLACWLWLRRQPVWSLVTVLMVVPWVNSLHQGVFFPNQSGWRFLWLPLTLIAFRLSRRVGIRGRSFAYGAIAALAILWNAETGVALAIGLVAHLGARVDEVRLRRLAEIALMLGAGSLIGVLAIAGMYYVAAGMAFPIHAVLSDITQKLGGLAFGLPMHFDPLAVLIFALAVWFALITASIRRRRALNAAEADRLAASAIVLVWAAYYIQQPDPWNLWSYLLPFGMLSAAAVSAATRLIREGAVEKLIAVSLGAAIAVAVGPEIVGNQMTAFDSLYRSASVGNADAQARLSGVVTSSFDKDAVEQQLAMIGSLPKDALVFTGHSYLLPKLSGRRDLFWLPDPAYLNAAKAAFKKLTRAVMARRPSVILIDEDRVQSAPSPHRPFFKALEQAIADTYSVESIDAGWAILRPRQ